jgi:hypothetical protein
VTKNAEQSAIRHDRHLVHVLTSHLLQNGKCGVKLASFRLSHSAPEEAKEAEFLSDLDTIKEMYQKSPASLKLRAQRKLIASNCTDYGTGTNC